MGFTFSEVRENCLLHPEIGSVAVLDNCPSTCDGEYGCHSELEFTENLTQIYCPNRYCTHKIAARLEAMAKDMKADGWGMSTCLEVVHKFKLMSPCMVFFIEKLPQSKYPIDLRVSAFDTKLKNICNSEKRRVQLWEVVRLLNIPSVADNARKIFDGYDSFEEAFEDIEKYQVHFIAEKLGLSEKSENGVLAVNTFSTLLEYKVEIIEAAKHFEIYKPEGVQLTIAVTGNVEGFSNRAEYIAYLNKKFSGKCNIILSRTVNAKLDILIVDAGESSSGKYESATKINAKADLKGGHKILIYTHEECEEALRQAFESN